MLKMMTRIVLMSVLLVPVAAAVATAESIPANGATELGATSQSELLVVAGRSTVTPMNARTQTIDMSDDDQGYDSSYIFGMTKGVAGSTMTPAVKPLVFLFTVPLDLCLLPFAAIGGFF